MKAKGFTLIELLAVIIILAIIALIAVPIILNVVETSRKNSAVDSAYGYINAIEEGIAIKEVKDGLSAPAGEYTDLRGFENTYNIRIKGTKPSEGTFTLERKTVVSAEFIIDGYRVICDKKLCRTTGKLKKITITYNAGAGTASESSVQINNGSSLTLPSATPTNSNYSFAGWYTGTNCSGNKITNTTPIEEDLDINACYVIKVTNFEYTGNIQSFTAPADGKYKLEVWGAAGAYIYVSGTFNGSQLTREWWSGRGAYSSGNVALKAGDVLYIAVGGKGEDRTISESTTTGSTEGGYNGGGSASDNYSGAGGGATHISKTNTLLKDTSVADLYIVAGGGGGAATALNGVYPTWGSGGGNASGSNTPGNGSCNACGGADYYGHGATQEAGGSPNGSYGQGGNATAGAGGGGGYYGGGSGTASGASGGGGSSYIGGVTNGVIYDGYTQQNTPNGGSTTGNYNGGYARITYLSE